MSPEENEAISRLLDPKAGAAEQKRNLKWIAEYLEESYILNLPTPKAVLEALERYAKSRQADAGLKTRAKNLIKKYGSS